MIENSKFPAVCAACMKLTAVALLTVTSGPYHGMIAPWMPRLPISLIWRLIWLGSDDVYPIDM